MSNDLKHTLYNPGDCIPEHTLFDYIDNRLSAKEQHLVEKHMIDCELCSDALEGLRLVKNRSRIADINKAVQEQIAAPEKKTGPTDFRIILSIAAGLLLLTGGVFFFRQFASPEKKESMAELKEIQQNQEQAEENKPAQSQVADEETAPGYSKGKEKLKMADQEQLEQPGKKPEEKDAAGTGYLSNAVSDELRQTDAAKAASPDVTTEAPVIAGTPSVSGNDNVSNTSTISSHWSPPPPPMEPAADKKASSKDEKEQDDVQKTGEVTDIANSESKNNNMSREKQQAVSKRDENRASGAENRKKEERKDVDKEPAASNEGLATGRSQSTFETMPDSTTTLSGETEQAYSVVDEMPKFPGGDAAMMKYIQANLKYPPIEKETAIAGKIYVQFIVDKKGNVKNPKIFKGLSPAFDQEVLRVVKNMPKWNPGKLKDKPVNVLVNIPVEIYLR
jgi:TonB family protein